MCEIMNSVDVTPATKLLSKSPSLRSITNARAVNATAAKNAILRSTPGAMNSVKDGDFSP